MKFVRFDPSGLLSNFKFRGYLRPLWPKMPHTTLFSFKYFIAREFFHIRLLSDYSIKIYQISLKLMCTLKWWAQLWKSYKFWNFTKLPFLRCITRFCDIATTQNNIGVFKFKRPTEYEVWKQNLESDILVDASIFGHEPKMKY